MTKRMDFEEHNISLKKRETQHETLSNSANLRLKAQRTLVTVSHSFRIIKVARMA